MLLIFATIIYFRERPVPDVVTLIVRVVLAISGGAAASMLGGDLALKFHLGIVVGQAAAGLGVFVMILFVNPPKLAENIILRREGPDFDTPPPPPPAKPRKRT